MAITYKCDLAKSGSLKDIFRSKVFGDTTGMVTGEFSAFNNRCEINEGRWVVDAEHRTVYVYIDFFILISQSSSDYWLQMTLPNFLESYLPQTTSTSHVANVLCTDESSEVPSNSFFLAYYSSRTGMYVRKGDTLTENDHYIVYDAWQY